jgi:hypothetical protein
VTWVEAKQAAEQRRLVCTEDGRVHPIEAISPLGWMALVDGEWIPISRLTPLAG